VKSRFYPQAEAELNEAVDYYDGCQEGLGLEFAKIVYAATKNICQYPQTVIRRPLTSTVSIFARGTT